MQAESPDDKAVTNTIGALECHISGLELQLIELVEQQKRAEAQGRTEHARRLQGDIDGLHRQLAICAETIASEG